MTPDTLLLCDSMPAAVPLSWALEMLAHTPVVSLREQENRVVNAPKMLTAAERGRRMAEQRRRNRAHLRAAKALRIRELLAAKVPYKRIAREVRVTQGTITRIANEVRAHG